MKYNKLYYIFLIYFFHGSETFGTIHLGLAGGLMMKCWTDDKHWILLHLEACTDVWFKVKCLNNYLMDCRDRYKFNFRLRKKCN